MPWKPDASITASNREASGEAAGVDGSDAARAGAPFETDRRLDKIFRLDRAVPRIHSGLDGDRSAHPQLKEIPLPYGPRHKHAAARDAPRPPPSTVPAA